jgi:hypothetical protein
MQQDKTDLEREKDVSFRNGTRQMAVIDASGGFRTYVRKNAAVAVRAFPNHVSCLCCMDERVVVQKGDAVYAAGSGILLKDNGAAREAFIRKLTKAGVTEVTLHEECGAVALYAKKKRITLAKAQKEAEVWARYLAKRIGGTYRGKRIGVGTHYHVARAAYYDMTGVFNPAQARHVFPPGFVVDRRYLSKPEAVREMRIAVDIATGAHGYGKRFDRRHPFVVAVVADNTREAEAARSELARLRSPLVAVKVCIRPKR